MSTIQNAREEFVNEVTKLREGLSFAHKQLVEAKSISALAEIDFRKFEGDIAPEIEKLQRLLEFKQNKLEELKNNVVLQTQVVQSYQDALAKLGMVSFNERKL